MNNSSAQDDTRESQQKELFGLIEEHIRDQTYDAVLDDIKIDFKTRATGKSCSTKRKYRPDAFKDVVLVVNEYKDKKTIRSKGHLIFPPGLKDWRKYQEEKLYSGVSPKPINYQECELLRAAIDSDNTVVLNLIERIEKEIHLGDPHIGLSIFKSDGDYIYIDRRKHKLEHPEWVVPFDENSDHKKLIREEISRYKEFLKLTGVGDEQT